MRSVFALAMLACSIFAQDLTDLEKGTAKTLNNPNTYTGPKLTVGGKELTSGGKTAVEEDATNSYNYRQMFVDVPTGALTDISKVQVATIVDSTISSSQDIEWAQWEKPDAKGEWKNLILRANSNNYASTGVAPAFPTIDMNKELMDQLVKSDSGIQMNQEMEKDPSGKKISKTGYQKRQFVTALTNVDWDKRLEVTFYSGIPTAQIPAEYQKYIKEGYKASGKMYLQVIDASNKVTTSVSDITHDYVFNADSSVFSYATSFAAVATAISMLAF